MSYQSGPPLSLKQNADLCSETKQNTKIILVKVTTLTNPHVFSFKRQDANKILRMCIGLKALHTINACFSGKQNVFAIHIQDVLNCRLLFLIR